MKDLGEAAKIIMVASHNKTDNQLFKILETESLKY